MVRLLVPEGEAQHAIVRRYPDPLAPQPTLVAAPWQTTLYAAGATTFLALVGKSRPGNFLKAAAYISVANISLSALDIYSRRELNRGIFKLANIEPKPGKLWERTKQWTTDDFVLNGAVLGVFVALNPRALPGVVGWKRFLGAATVGSGLGSYVASNHLGRFPPEALKIMHQRDTQIRGTMYERLKEDAKARESLSGFGRLALAWHTWPIWDIQINPFKRAHASQAHQVDFSQDSSNEYLSNNLSDPHRYYNFQALFWKEELDGPDIEDGCRAFKDDLEHRDLDALNDTLERMKKARKANDVDSQFLMQLLVTREHKFYKMDREDRDKDILRRELQLLHALTIEFATRDAILASYIGDTQKRLEQASHKNSASQSDNATALLAPGELPAGWSESYSPDLITKRVRIHWLMKRDQLSGLEHVESTHFSTESGADAELKKHHNKIRIGVENTRRNAEATTRLLRALEDQIQQAERRAHEATRSQDDA